MTAGVTTPNLPMTAISDSVLVNRGGNTTVQLIAALAQQLIATPPFAVTAFATVAYFRGSLADLSLITPAAGTHGAVLSNDDQAGIYEYTGSLWVRRAPIPAVMTESLSAIEARAARDEVIAALATIGTLSDLQALANAAVKARGAAAQYASDAAAFAGPMRTFFVANDGNDAATGLSPAAAFRTLAKATSVAVRGDVVSLARGSVFREYAAFGDAVSLRAHGVGRRPIVTGYDIAPPAAISHRSGNVYNLTVDLPLGWPQRAYAMLYEDGRHLREYRIGLDGLTDNAGVIAAVEANPGSYAFVTWTTNPTTNSGSGGWAAGTNTFVLHPTGSGNPAGNGKLYEYGARYEPIRAPGGIEDIDLQIGYGHDGVIETPMRRGSITRIARHGTLPKFSAFEDVDIVGGNPAYTGGGLQHTMGDAASSAVSRTVQRRVRLRTGWADRFGSPGAKGFYAHGSDTINYIRERDTLIDCEGWGLSDFMSRGAHREIAMVRCRGRDGVLISGGFLPTEYWIADSEFETGQFQTSGSGAGRAIEAARGGAFHLWRSKFRHNGGSFFFHGAASPGACPEIDVRECLLVTGDTITSGGFQTDMLVSYGKAITAPISVERSILIAEGAVTYPMGLSGIGAGGSVRVRDTLLVWERMDGRRGASGEPVISVNNVETRIDSLDPDATVFQIAPARVIAGWTDDRKPILRHGSYRPGDATFKAVAFAGGSNMPRQTVAVGRRVAVASEGQAVPSLRMSDYIPSRELLAVVSLPDQSYLAVGHAALVTVSAGSGFNLWTERTPAAASGETLRGVAATVAGRIIAVGDGGTIITSDDAGVTWTARVSGVTTRLNAVSIARDGSRAYAVGHGGVCLISTDGGDTWAAASPAPTGVGALDLYAVHVSPGLGKVIIGGDSYLATLDITGGTWARWTTPTNRVVGIGVDYKDGNAPGSNNHVITTALYQTGRQTTTMLNSMDGGATWAPDPYILPFEARGITSQEVNSRRVVSPYVEMGLTIVGDSQHVAQRRIGQAWELHRATRNMWSGADVTLVNDMASSGDLDLMIGLLEAEA